MQTAAFHIAVIAAGVFAAVRGWRCGLSAQTSSVLGMAFGLTVANMSGEWAEGTVAGWNMVADYDCRREFIIGNLGRGMVYTVVYLGVDFLTGILNRLLRPLGKGLLNSLAGSLFCILAWMIWASIALNALLCLHPTCGLENCGDQGDGNLVAEVMLLAPALLGTEDVCELWHACRLHDARLISSTYRNSQHKIQNRHLDVIITETQRLYSFNFMERDTPTLADGYSGTGGNMTDHNYRPC